MKKNKEILMLATAYILALLAMFILPLFSVPGYTIIRNTLSELGAQSAPNAWVMNLIFVFLGVSSVIAGWGYFKGYVFQRIILLLFGIFLVLIAFFNHAPVNPDIRYNLREDWWHAYFAFSAGLSFVILSITTGLITEKQQDRPAALVAGISTIFFSIMMSEADRFAGIWNRFLFIIMFGWLIYNFKTGNYRNRNPNG